METNTYSPIDLDSWTEGTDTLVNAAGAASPDGQISVSGSDSDSKSDGGGVNYHLQIANALISGIYAGIGPINYDTGGNQIPTGSLIFATRVRMSGFVTASASGSAIATIDNDPDGGNAQVFAGGACEVNITVDFQGSGGGGNVVGTVYIDSSSDDDTCSDCSGASASGSIAGGVSIDFDTVIEVIHDPPLTKVEFLELYQNCRVSMAIASDVSGSGTLNDVNCPIPGTVAYSCNALAAVDASVSNWELEVDFESSEVIPLIELTQTGGYEISGSGADYTVQSGGYEVTGGGLALVPANAITQTGGYEISGGGVYGGNVVTQSGGYLVSGGGSDNYFLFPDISGIYVIEPRKRDDTWYDRSGPPDATIDVKIPDPFVSLAFLPKDN
mgnify:CR=1 FL=1